MLEAVHGTCKHRVQLQPTTAVLFWVAFAHALSLALPHSCLPASYVRTAFLKDKLLIFMCCLALIIDNYTLNLNVLASDLMMPQKR